MRQLTKIWNKLNSHHLKETEDIIESIIILMLQFVYLTKSSARLNAKSGYIFRNKYGAKYHQTRPLQFWLLVQVIISWALES